MTASSGTPTARLLVPVWLPWALAGAAVATQIPYPLVPTEARTVLTLASVLTFAAASTAHAAVTRGGRWAAAYVATSTGVGLAAEAIGVHTGWPFGAYSYSGSLGPGVAGVPAVVPLAWAMMAYPALTLARYITGSTARGVLEHCRSISEPRPGDRGTHGITKRSRGSTVPRRPPPLLFSLSSVAGAPYDVRFGGRLGSRQGRGPKPIPDEPIPDELYRFECGRGLEPRPLGRGEPDGGVPDDGVPDDGVRAPSEAAARPAGSGRRGLPAGRYRRVAGTALAGGLLLTGWDLFLDPQMAAEGHWVWAQAGPALNGIPLTNTAGWLLVGTVLTGLLAALPERGRYHSHPPPGHPPPGHPPPGHPPPGRLGMPRGVPNDRLPFLLLGWTYFSSVLANLAFFGRPAVALAGGLGMGAVLTGGMLRTARPRRCRRPRASSGAARRHPPG